MPMIETDILTETYIWFDERLIVHIVYLVIYYKILYGIFFKVEYIYNR